MSELYFNFIVSSVTKSQNTKNIFISIMEKIQDTLMIFNTLYGKIYIKCKEWRGVTYMAKELITQEQIMDLLNKCYEGAMNGLPGSKPCDELAYDYMDKYKDVKEAAKKLIDNQVVKCTTSGFVTSLGGLITLPVAVPANVASVLYIQMRMIGSLAIMGGYDLKDDEVKTLVYLCLVNNSMTEICKSAGVKVANKMTLSMLKKLPGKVLTKINQKVGFRLVTKFGQKGVVNLVKLVPIAGGVVGGGMDFVETKMIADKAYNTFLLNELK